MSILKLTFKN